MNIYDSLMIIPVDSVPPAIVWTKNGSYAIFFNDVWHASWSFSASTGEIGTIRCPLTVSISNFYYSAEGQQGWSGMHRHSPDAVGDAEVYFWKRICNVIQRQTCRPEYMFVGQWGKQMLEFVLICHYPCAMSII